MVTHGFAKKNVGDACSSYSWLMFCRRLIVLVTVAGLSGRLAAQDTARSLRSEFLMELRAELEQPSQELGETPLGIRHIVYVKGGSFSGPKTKGDVSRGGGELVFGSA